MKKKIKILLLFIFIILLTGCSGNYNININEDLSVDENLYLTMDNNSNNYINTLKIFDNNNIDKDKYDISLNGKEVIIEYKDKFNTIDEYLLKSKVYHQLIDEISYNKTNDYIDIYVNQYLKLKGNDNIGNTSDLDVLQINVTTPFKMIINNADISNDNTYTWTINKDSKQKKIIISFMPKLNSFPYSQAIMISVLIVTITIIVITLIKRLKNSQKI